MDHRDASDVRQPPKTFGAILKSVGPGLIISANIVGSGELIATTVLGAEVGFLLLWFIIFSCFIKVFVQVELGRFAISEGVSILEALNRIPGPRLVVSWVLWLWLFMFVGTLFQLSGMVGALAQVFDLGVHGEPQEGPSGLWPVLIAVAVIIPLIIGRYKLIERFATSMVVLFTFVTIGAVISIQFTDQWAIGLGDIGKGLSFRMPPSFTTAFYVFGITGVGASELIYYPIWCLEKGYAKYVGPRQDTPEWTERARAWVRVMRIDAWLAMVIYTVATVAFYLLGAAILEGKPVENATLMATLSTMYSEAFGQVGRWVFLVGAFMVLFSTLFISTASNSRLIASGTTVFRIFKTPSEQRRQLIVRIGSVGIPCLLVLVYWTVGKPLTLVFIGALGQAMILPFLGLAALFFRHHQTLPSLRPDPAWTTFLWTSYFLMLAVGLYNVWEKAADKWYQFWIWVYF